MTHPRKQRILKIFGKEPENLDELARCVIACTETRTKKVLGLAWNIHHQDLVSNTHSFPLDGVSNWHGHKDKPRGYPGWTGRVWLRLNTSKDWDIGDSLTYTGTGGGGGYGGLWENLSTMYYQIYGHKPAPKDAIIDRPCIYSWDYRFFDSDWPGIANEIEQQRIMAALRGTKPIFTHKFSWEDPAQKALDDQFIQYYREKMTTKV